MSLPVIRLEEVVGAVAGFLASGKRILGLAGPPGVGKSTLAARIVAGVDVPAVVLGLDGYHLAQEQLERLGRAGRKGAPDTFDACGYRATLERVRHAEADVYSPRFDRTIENSVAAAVVVRPGHRLVVGEGNYLLVDDDVWRPIRALFDECWYLDGDDMIRRQRLVQRHIDHGRTPAAAEEWVGRSDDVNAALVAATRANADLIVSIDG